MEGHAVVEAFVGKLNDPLDMAGREVRAKLDHDIAAAGQGEGKGLGRVGHAVLSC